MTTSSTTPTGFRHWIEDRADALYRPEPNRYHLYVSYACPFAHRCLATLKVKKLDQFIGISVVHPVYQRTRPQDPNDHHVGWTFADPIATPTLPGTNGVGAFSSKGATADTVNGVTYVRDLYDLVTDAPMRYTVPVLWDKQTKTIVNNETADIVKILNSAFQLLVPDSLDLYPEDLQDGIETADKWVQDEVFSGVFGAAFAPEQAIYDRGVEQVLTALNHAESILSKQRFFVGNGERFTEADLRLFVGLMHFNVYMLFYTKSPVAIENYPNVLNYLRDIYQYPGMQSTVNFDHLRLHYVTARKFSPNQGVEVGAIADWSAPHDRQRFTALGWSS